MIRENIELLGYFEQYLIRNKEVKDIKKHIYKKNEEIFVQNSYIKNVCILKSGLVKCFLTDESGKDFIQEFFGAGSVFGEIEAIRNTQTFCTVTTITTTEVYEIEAVFFNKLLQENKKFNALILQLLSNKVYNKAMRYSYHQLHIITDNLLQIKENMPDFLGIIPKQDLANYLGVTLRSLNRAVTTLKNERKI